MAFTIPFDITTRPGGEWLPNTPVAVTTDPGPGVEVVVEQIVLSNFDSGAHTVDLWIGGTSNVNLIAKAVSVPANDCVVLDETYILTN